MFESTHGAEADFNNYQPPKVEEHEEKVVGGNANFLELLEKEMAKEKGGGIVEIESKPKKKNGEEEGKPKPKPKKTFLKKGKQLEDIEKKGLENRMKNVQDRVNENSEFNDTPEKPQRSHKKEPVEVEDVGES